MSRGVLAAAVLIAAGWTGILAQNLPDGTVANHVVIEKAARTLKLYSDGRLLKTYPSRSGPTPQVPRSVKATDERPRGDM
jgi:hypothetical protein